MKEVAGLVLAHIYYYLVVESTGAGDDKYVQIKSVTHNPFFFFFDRKRIPSYKRFYTHTHACIYIYNFFFLGLSFIFYHFSLLSFIFVISIR